MFYKSSEGNSSSITLEQFCKEAEEYGCIDNTDMYEQLASQFQALSNNATLLSDFFLNEIETGFSLQKKNKSSIQTFLLFSSDLFDIRINCWPSLKQCNYEKQQFFRDHFYCLAHDHNFHFMTVGLFGPGYTTDIFEYDPNEVKGFEGESVELNYLGRYTLSKGDVMYYVNSKHIHIQYPPEDFSISLNIIPKQIKEKEQFFFDPKQQKIQSTIKNESSREILENLVAQIDNPQLKTEYERFLNKKKAIKI